VATNHQNRAWMMGGLFISRQKNTTICCSAFLSKKDLRVLIVSITFPVTIA
jgi:hypothetical protein